MPTRVSLVMQMSTTPPSGSQAVVHTAGWTESVWAANPVGSDSVWIRRWAHHRSALLPTSAKVVGFRIANYTILGNKFKPAGTASGKLNYPGSSGQQNDVPQLALEVSFSTSEGPNVSRSVLRCLPDSQVTGGEFSPDSRFQQSMQAFISHIIEAHWRFPGRKLSNPSMNIVGIAGNVVTLTGALGAVANVSSVRFLNAKADGGATISGAYLVTAVAGNTLTLAGYSGGNMTVPSGKMRIDEVDTYLITDGSVGRVVTKKVGRPFESYRGRASKRR